MARLVLLATILCIVIGAQTTGSKQGGGTKKGSEPITNPFGNSDSKSLTKKRLVPYIEKRLSSQDQHKIIESVQIVDIEKKDEFNIETLRIQLLNSGQLTFAVYLFGATAFMPMTGSVVHQRQTPVSPSFVNVRRVALQFEAFKFAHPDLASCIFYESGTLDGVWIQCQQK